MIDSSDCCTTNGDSNSQHDLSNNTGIITNNTQNQQQQHHSLTGLTFIHHQHPHIHQQHHHHTNGGSEDDEHVPHVLREQDRYLPIANVAKIMKKAIPERGKIAKDAKECVQECLSEFISFITSEAAERCALEKRKTINGEDILYAMQTLGFDNYVEPLKIFLQKYRDVTKCDKGSNVTSSGSTTTTTTSTTLTNVNCNSITNFIQQTDSTGTTLSDDFLATAASNGQIIILSNGTAVQAQNIIQISTNASMTSRLTQQNNENQLLVEDDDDDDDEEDEDDFEELGMKSNNKRLKRSTSSIKQQQQQQQQQQPTAFIINATDSKIF